MNLEHNYFEYLLIAFQKLYCYNCLTFYMYTNSAPTLCIWENVAQISNLTLSNYKMKIKANILESLNIRTITKTHIKQTCSVKLPTSS